MIHQWLIACLLVAFVVADPFDSLARQQGQDISLANIATTVPSTSSTSRGVVTDGVIGCGYKVHNILGLTSDSNSGVLLNKGNFLSVIVENINDNVGSEDLIVELVYTASETPILPVWEPRDPSNSSFVYPPDHVTVYAQCSAGSYCVLDYLCNALPFNASAVEVLIYQATVSTTSFYNTYRVQVTQYRERILPFAESFSLTKTTLNLAETVSTYAGYDSTLFSRETSVVGPRKWRHYYADLTRDLGMTGSDTAITLRLFNVRNGTNNVTSGNVVLCYSDQPLHLPAADSAYPGTSPLGTGYSSICGSPVCAQVSLSGSPFDDLKLRLPDCSQKIFIGVRTPFGTPATYSLSLSIDPISIYPVVLHPLPYSAQGYLYNQVFNGGSPQVVCNTTGGAFACDKYYYPTGFSVNSGFDFVTGPYYFATLRSVTNGQATLSLADFGLLGPAAIRNGACVPTIVSCTANSAAGNYNECIIRLDPCYWNSSRTVRPVSSVYTLAPGSAATHVGFDVDFELVSFPVVAVTSDQTYFGELLKQRYNHYSYVVAPTDINPYAALSAELYSRESSIPLDFQWNLNIIPTKCTSYQGTCRLDFNVDANQRFAHGDGGYCRFYFPYCNKADYAIPFNLSIYEGPDYFSYSGTVTNGLKGASLTAGTYFFTVAAGMDNDDFGDQQYYRHTAEYTLTFHFVNTVQPLKLGETVLQHVFEYEHSRQFTVAIPTDPLVSGIRFVISDVTNFRIGYGSYNNFEPSTQVNLYVRCGAAAGSCPCLAYDQLLETQMYQGANYLDFSKCSCPSGQLYARVEFDHIHYNFDTFRGVGYTITALTQYYPDYPLSSIVNTTLFSTDRIIVPGRYPVRARLSSTFERNLDIAALLTTATLASSPDFCGNCENYRFYYIDTTQATSKDALLVRVAFSLAWPDIFNYYPLYAGLEGELIDGLMLYVLSSTTATVTDTGCTVTSTLSGSLQICNAAANSGFPDNNVAEPTCQLVFEPCVLASSQACYNEDLFLQQPQVTRRFNPVDRWFIAVQILDLYNFYGIGYGFGGINLQEIPFTLSVSLKDQTVATSLTSGVPLHDFGEEGTYKHYSLTVGTGVLNTAFFEFYNNHEERFVIQWFMNKNGLAGKDIDCYGNCEQFCLTDDVQSLCYNQLRPCDLQGVSTLYISAYQPTFDLTQFVGQSNGYQVQYFDNLFEYTIIARITQPTELLGSSAQAGWPVAVNLRQLYTNYAEVVYFTVTLPSLPSNAVGQRLTIRVFAGNDMLDSVNTPVSDLLVRINDNVAPVCSCVGTGYPIADVDNTDVGLTWIRDWCYLNGAAHVFYVEIDTIGGFDTHYLGNPGSFTIQAFSTPITQDIINPVLANAAQAVPNFTLPFVARYSSDNSSNITGQFLPVPSPLGPFRLRWAQYRTFRFDVRHGNAMQLNYVLSTTTTTGQTVEAWLSTGIPVGSQVPGYSGDVNFRLGVVPSCSALLASCTFSDSVVCAGIVDACTLKGITAANFFLTIGGDQIGLDYWTDVHIKLTYVDQVTILNTSTADSWSITSNIPRSLLGLNGVTSSPDPDNNNNVHYFQTVAPFDVKVGQQVTFTAPGASAIHVGYGTDVCNLNACQGTTSCTVVVCTNAPSSNWLVRVDGLSATTDTTFTIQKFGSITNQTVPTPVSPDNLAPVELLSADNNFFQPMVSGTYKYVRIAYPANAANIDYLVGFKVCTNNTDFSNCTAPANLYVGYVGTNVPYEYPTLTTSATTYRLYPSTGLSDQTVCGTSVAENEFYRACCVLPFTRLYLLQATGDVQGFRIVWKNVAVHSLPVQVTSDSTTPYTVGRLAASSSGFIREVRHHVIQPDANTLGYWLYIYNPNTSNPDSTVYFNYNSRAGSSSACPTPSQSSFDGNFDSSACHNNFFTSNLGSNGLVGYIPCVGDDDLYLAFTSSAPTTYVIRLVKDQGPIDVITSTRTVTFPPVALPGSQPSDPGFGSIAGPYRRVYQFNVINTLATFANWFPDISADSLNRNYRFVVDVSVSTGNVVVLPGNQLNIGSVSSACGGSPSACGVSPVNPNVTRCDYGSLALGACTGSTFYIEVSRQSGNQNTTYSVTFNPQLLFNNTIVGDNNIQTVTASNFPNTGWGVLPTTYDWRLVNSRNLSNTAPQQNTENWLKFPVTTGLNSYLVAHFRYNASLTLPSGNVRFYQGYNENVLITQGSAPYDLAPLSYVFNGYQYDSYYFTPEQFRFYVSTGNSMWIRVTYGATTTPYQFAYSLELASLAPFKAAAPLTELAPIVWNKRIYNRQWQFFEFSLTPNTGYYYSLSLVVDNVDCLAGASALSVATSWSADGLYDFDIPVPGDNLAPYGGQPRVASEYGYNFIDSVVASSTSVVVTPSCRVHGGTYRFSTFAHTDSQFFPTPVNVSLINPVSNTTLIEPVTYRATVTVQKWPFRTIGWECTDVQTWKAGSPFVPRYEIVANGENRGTQVWFTLTVTSSVHTTGPWTLYASSNPSPNDVSGCAWGTSTTWFDYATAVQSGEGTVTLAIPANEFRGGKIYLYIDNVLALASGEVRTFSLYPHKDQKYIPILALPNTHVVWQGDVVSERYQYYRVQVDKTKPESKFEALLFASNCLYSNCQLQMTALHLHAAGYSTPYTSNTAVGTCDTTLGLNADHSVTVDGSNCVSVSPFKVGSVDMVSSGNPLPTSPAGLTAYLYQGADAYPLQTDYYIGVVRQGAYTEFNAAHCVYNLEIRTAEVVEPLFFNSPLCAFTGCYRNYLVTPSTGLAIEDYSSVTVTVYGTNNNIDVYSGWNRVPYYRNMDNLTLATGKNVFSRSATLQLQWGAYTAVTAGSSATLTYYPNQQCILNNKLYVSIYNPAGDIETCDVCSGANYRIEVTGVLANNTGRVRIDAISSSRLLTGTSSANFLGNAYGTCNVCGGSQPYLLGPTTVPVWFTSSNVAAVAPGFGQLSSSSVVFGSGAAAAVKGFSFTVTDPGTVSFTVNDYSLTECGDSLATVSYIIINANATYCCSDMALVGGTVTGDGSFSACLPVGSYYLIFYTGATVCSVQPDVCPVSFVLTLTPVTPRAPSGDTHKAPFIPLARSAYTCTTANTNLQFAVDVVDILSVHLRYPEGLVPVASPSVNVAVATVSQACTMLSYNGAVAQDLSGDQHSVRITNPTASSWYFSCMTPGRYYVDVALTAPDANYDLSQVDLQIVNKWVPLSGVESGLLFGKQRHFFSVSTSTVVSLAAQLTIVSGPSLEFSIFEGCSRQAIGWESLTVCSAGLCQVDIATRALHPGATTFYIVLTGAQLSGANTWASTSNTQRNANSHTAKSTSYQLSVGLGSANCIAPTFTGFCSATFAPFNELAIDIPSSVWKYNDFALKEKEAQCRYNNIIKDRCPVANTECQRWTRIWSCLESFPACDSDGFVQGMCRAVCDRLECSCGKWLGNQGERHSEYQCLSSRYVNGTSGSCRTIPAPAPPVPTPTPEPIIANPDDTCHVWIATLDDRIVLESGVTFSKRAVDTSACTEAQIRGIVQRLLGPRFDVNTQFQLLDQNPNEFSILLLGNNFQSCVSTAVELINAAYSRPSFFENSCLRDALFYLDDPDELIGLTPDPINQGPPGPPGPPGVPGAPGSPGGSTPGVTITPRPIVSYSSAAFLLPSLFALLAVIFAML